MNQTLEAKSWTSYFLMWTIALVATLGSLFFSEVMDYPPCVLCWYQRICMYPLTILLLVRLFQKEGAIVPYIFTLATIGQLIAFYHNLLYYKILPENVSPCRQGISCTSVHIEWFGFVTIPFLSWCAFSMIMGLCFWHLRKRLA